MPATDSTIAPHPDIAQVLFSPDEIRDKVAELATRIRDDYADSPNGPLLMVGVLKGAVMFMADLARQIGRPIELEFIAISSYGASTSSSGVVRILKDLERDIAGRDVLLVEDIIDTGLTLSWLRRNFASRNPASVNIAAMFRKPDAVRVQVDASYVGFDIPNDYVVGYGLDFAQRYRELPYLGVLSPSVYEDRSS